MCTYQSETPHLSLFPFFTPSNCKFLLKVYKPISIFVNDLNYAIFLDSTYTKYHMIFLFLCLTSFR